MYRPLLVFVSAFFLVTAPEALAQTRDRLVILVRHAEAGGEPARNPPLTPAGTARADALAAVLADAGIEAIIVSPRQRTALTAGPLTGALGLEPVVVGFGSGVEEHVQAVADAVRAQTVAGPILVVGHSNTIPSIIGALGGPDMPDLCHGAFANLFILELPADGPPRLIRGSYGTPDPDDPCA